MESYFIGFFILWVIFAVIYQKSYGPHAVNDKLDKIISLLEKIEKRG